MWAKLKNEATSGKERIRGFLVEKGIKGFSAPEQKRKHSLRASVTSELILQDVFVPGGEPAAQRARAQGRRSAACRRRASASRSAWSARPWRASTRATEYSKSRIMFGKPIGSFQLVQAELAEHADRDHQGAAAERSAADA